MYTGNGRGKRRCACRISLRSTAGGFPGAPPLPKGGNHSREGKAQLPFECKSKTHVTSKARSPRWRRRRHVALPSGTDISLCVCVCVCYAYGMLSFVVHTAQLRVRHIPHKADVSPMTCDVNMADLWAYWKRIFLAWVEGGCEAWMRGNHFSLRHLSGVHTSVSQVRVRRRTGGWEVGCTHSHSHPHTRVSLK